jgi:hypothetical protein
VMVKSFWSATFAFYACRRCSLSSGVSNVLALRCICLCATCPGVTLTVSVSVGSGLPLHYHVSSYVDAHLYFYLDADEMKRLPNHPDPALRVFSCAYFRPHYDLVVCSVLCCAHCYRLLPGSVAPQRFRHCPPPTLSPLSGPGSSSSAGRVTPRPLWQGAQRCGYQSGE